jgi:lysophospholipase L1-like esterase
MTKIVPVQHPKLPRRHPMTAKLLLLMLSTVFSLAIAEIVLRLIQTEPYVAHQLFCEHHPVLGWQKKPNFSGIHVSPEEIYRVRETMNSKGLRGPEYPYKKPPEEFRIVVLGDSFAEGYTVEFNNLFSEALKRGLNTDERRPVQVINAGTGGYSTDQELLWFTTEGVKYDPDLAILLFCTNDVLFNTVDRYWRGFKPLFRMEGETLELTNVPVPPPLPPVQRSASPLLRFKRWMNDSSYLYMNLRSGLRQNEKITSLLEWVGYAQRRTTSAESHDAMNSDEDGRSPAPDFKRLSDWSQATEQERDAGWTITKALLLKLKAEAESKGCRLLVMTVPGEAEVTSGVESICRENSMDCINPTERFRDEELKLNRQGKQLTFAPLDLHWNAEGHRLVAEVLGEHIVTHGHLSRPTDPRVDTTGEAPIPNQAIGHEEE